MNPTRMVSIAIGLVAVIGVLAVALMGGRFAGSRQPTAEEAAAAAIAEGAKEGAKTVAAADRSEAEDPWAADDGWSEAEEEPVDDEPGVEAPAPPVSAPAPAAPEPPSSADSNPPVAVVLR